MLIEQHDQCYIVELKNGSRWQIWPADIAVTLKWLPTTELQVVPIDDAFCSHVLIDAADGSRVRVAGEGVTWPVELVREALKEG